VEGFAASQEAFSGGDPGRLPGHLLVKADWNCARRPIEELWNQHIGITAGFLGAKQVGSAPWRLGQAAGLEAEIVLPQKENRRLWAGILAHGFTVLQFLVAHPLEDRPWFEPLATRTISSLRFPERMEGVVLTPEDLPLPPGCPAIDPLSAIPDIADPAPWRAYGGGSETGALQAFYLREAPNYGWQVEAYVPFPSDSELGFARLDLVQGERRAVLGILPVGNETVSANSPAKIVVKYQ
jgi:hypothetical protein